MEIPKRKFALEERDLAIEADENNKIAEEKENRFVAKIQQEALKNIDHKNTDKALERLPNPTGWRILVLPYKGQGKTKGGIILSDETCLLYTSPSPRDGLLSRMPSSA